MAVPIRRINPDLLRIHAEDAGFVAAQRALALEAPNYRLADIYDLEQRLHGHLDALVLAGEAGAETVQAVAVAEATGAAAGTLLHVALRGGRRDLAETALALAEAEEDPPAARAALGRAVAWCDREVLSGVMRGWITSAEPLLRWIAFDVCGIHRVDPRDHLDRGLADPAPEVRARAARLAGEVGRIDALPALRTAEEVEAGIAALLLGDRDHAAGLVAAASFPDDAPTARRLAELFPLALPEAEAQAAIRALLGGGETRRWGFVALGALGAAGVLPWLVQAMEAPGDARMAAAAFEQITGVYMAHDGLERDDFPEDPEDSAEAYPGEALIEANTPWPDIERVRRWLDANGDRFPAGERLLLGLAAWSFDGPPEAWVRFQARFRAIALTQAMARPDAPLPNWHAPVWLQGAGFTRAW